jgi:hypothetical protein
MNHNQFGNPAGPGLILNFHAVLEACMSVSDKLRTLAGETGDGTKLVDVLCFPPPPRGSDSTPWPPSGSARSRPGSRP